jgi:hypothetical protein
MEFFDFIKGILGLLFLQAGWSYQKRQALGFLYILSIFYHKLQGTFFTKANMVYDNSFNTNPYCSGVILGLFLQEKALSENYLIGLLNLYGSLGDEFFWRNLRPLFFMTALIIPFYGYLINNSYNLPSNYFILSIMFPVFFIIISQGMRFYWFIKSTQIGYSAAWAFAYLLKKFLPLLYCLKAFISGMVIILLFLVLLFGFTEHIISLKSIVIYLILIGIILMGLIRIFANYEISSYLLIIGLLIFLIIKII